MDIQFVKHEQSGKTYKVFNRTAYHKDTSDEVIKVLDRYIHSDKRVRIFYGDTKTGRDWNEEHYVIGYLGRSCGKFKVPLMLASSNSVGGPAILDHCIVKITVDKRTVYKHPKYDHNRFTVKKIWENEEELFAMGYRFKVVRNGREVIANFKDEVKAYRYVSFMKGERNKTA